MSSNNDVTIEASQDAIKAGDKARAMELLLEAARQAPKDYRPWMMMVRLALTRESALAYLRQAQIINPEIPSIQNERDWIEKNFNGTPSEEVILEPIKDSRKVFWLKGLPKYVSLIYLAFLVLAEVVTTVGEPPWGMLLHGMILVALVLHGSLYGQSREQSFLLSLSFAPLIRLVSFTTPLSSFPPLYWYAIVGLPLFLAAYTLIRITGLKRPQVGLKLGSFFPQLLIALSGVALGYIEYLILRPDPLVTEFSWEAILVPALILLVFTGFLEELIFRGVFQYIALRHLGRWGFYYVAVVFAVLHIGYQSVVDVVFVFLVALLFGFAVRRTGSLLGVTIAHGLTNIGLYLIFPFIL